MNIVLIKPHRYYCLLAGLIMVIAVQAQRIIDDRIVLSISKVSITGYEIEKHLAIARDMHRQKNNTTATDTEIGQWINSFIDRCYLLADAYSKGYDTIPETNRWVKAMEHYIISHPGGLLDDKLTRVPTEKEIMEGLQKNARKVCYRYLKFPNYNRALDFLDGNIFLKNNAEFENAIGKAAANSFIKTGEDSVQWPFWKHGEREENILNLKKGEVSSLQNFSDGFYIVQVRRIEIIDTSTLAPQLRRFIAEFIRRNKREKARTDYYARVMREAEIILNNVVVEQLEDHLRSKGAINRFDETMFNDLRSRPIFTYHINGKQEQVSAAEWMDYYNDIPMRQELLPGPQLKSYLELMVYDEYAYRKAAELGITMEPGFILDRENYKKNIVWFIYEREELMKSINITEDDIKKTYESNKQQYTEATDALVSVFHFASRREAIQGIPGIREAILDSSVKMKAKKIEWHKSVHYKDGFFNDSIVSVIFSMKDGDISGPLYTGQDFVIIHKGPETGSRIKDLNELRQAITKQLKEERLAEKKRLYLQHLKKKYPVHNEIEMSKYYRFAKN